MEDEGRFQMGLRKVHSAMGHFAGLSLPGNLVFPAPGLPLLGTS